MKKTWPLENLDCANCAAKMEAEMAKLPGVDSVRVHPRWRPAGRGHGHGNLCDVSAAWGMLRSQNRRPL